MTAQAGFYLSQQVDGTIDSIACPPDYCLGGSSCLASAANASELVTNVIFCVVPVNTCDCSPGFHQLLWRQSRKFIFVRSMHQRL